MPRGIRQSLMKKLGLLLIHWCLWYLAFGCRTIISPVLPVIENELGLSHAMAGALYLFAAIGTTIASLSSGFLSSRFGAKNLLVYGFILGSGACFGIYFATSYMSLAFFLFFFGMSGGFYLPCAIPIITSIFDQKYWGRALSIHETAASFSILSLPFIVGFALGYIEWRLLFVILAIISIIMILAFQVSAPSLKPQKQKGSSFASVISRPDFLVILFLWINCSMTSMGVYNIIPLYLVDDKSMDLDAANRIFAYSRIGGFLGQLSIGLILDRLSTKKILFALILLSGFSTLGMALINNFPVFVCFLLLQGTFSVAFFPVGLMAISKLSSVEERTMYTGTIMAISQTIGLGLTPFLLGAIADLWDFHIGLILLGLLTICHLPMFYFLKNKL